MNNQNIVLICIVVALTIIAIISCVGIYSTKEGINGTSPPAKTPCDDCMEAYEKCLTPPFDFESCRKELCACMTAAGTAGGCTQAEIAASCIAKSPCDDCMEAYGICMSNKCDFENCRKDLCTCMQAAGTAGGCTQAEIDENCRALPPSSKNPTSCAPPGGDWGSGRPGMPSTLNSPCCQPSFYQLFDADYKGCCAAQQETDKTIRGCLEECCEYCKNQAPFFDSSWAPMCQCGCSLCCYNFKEPHFSKFGTCVHYIQGDPAEAETPDTPGFIDFTPAGTT